MESIVAGNDDQINFLSDFHNNKKKLTSESNNSNQKFSISLNSSEPHQQQPPSPTLEEEQNEDSPLKQRLLRELSMNSVEIKKNINEINEKYNNGSEEEDDDDDEDLVLSESSDDGGNNESESENESDSKSIGSSSLGSISMKEELENSKEALIHAKLTITSLIEQISDYQKLVEEERERDKEEFLLRIEELQDEIETLKSEKNHLAISNVKNLETLMKEIEFIEVTNTELKDSLDNEKKLHNDAIKTIFQLREDLLKKSYTVDQLQQQQQQINNTNPSSFLSQMTLELKVLDGNVSNIRLISSNLDNSTNSLKNSNSSTKSNSSSIIELEEERNSLMKKLLVEKEKNEKTIQLLQEEKQKSESSKASIDELIKKIKELVKTHTMVLKELEEERAINQKKTEQISELKLQLSRPTQPKLQRTHSSLTTLKRTNNSIGRSKDSSEDVTPLNKSPDGMNGSSMALSKSTNCILSLARQRHGSVISGSISTSDSSDNTNNNNNNTEEVSIPTTSTKIQEAQEVESNNNNNATNTTPTLQQTQQILNIKSNSSTPTTATFSLSSGSNSPTETSPSKLSPEARLLRRSTALFDLNNRRNIPVENENMIKWLNTDPTTAPIQCMLEVGMSQIWVGCSDGSIKVVDKETCSTIAVRQGHSPHGIYTMIVVGKTVWTSSRDPKIKVWSIKSGKLLKELDGHTSHVTGLQLAGQSVWSISADMMIRVWNPSSYRCIKKIESKNYLVSITRVGTNQIWIGTESAILRWDANTYEPLDILQGHKKMIHCMIQVDNHVWSCSSDNLICVWDPFSGQCIKKLIDHKSRVFYLLRVNSHVWSCAWDKTIKIHNINTLELVKEIEPVHRDAISCMLTFKSNGGIGQRQIWSGSWDHTIAVWKSISPPTPINTTSRRSSINLISSLGSFNGTPNTSNSSLSGLINNGTGAEPSSPRNNGSSTTGTNSNPTPSKTKKHLLEKSSRSVRLSLFFGKSNSNNSSNELIDKDNNSNNSNQTSSNNTKDPSLSPRHSSPSLRHSLFSSSPSSSPIISSPVFNSPNTSTSNLSNHIPSHDLIKISLNYSIPCSVCNSKISVGGGPFSTKKAYHCNNCLGYFHMDCVDKSANHSCIQHYVNGTTNLTNANCSP
eukprot:gene8430-10349_t